MQLDLALLQIEANYFSEQNFNIFVTREDLSNRCCDLGRGQSGRSDLVKQGLKSVMVSSIHHGNLHR